MKVTKHYGNEDLGTVRKITFKEEDKILTLYFAKNDALYMAFISQKDNFFEITKENENIYEAFSNFYDDIKDNKLFEVDEYDIKAAKTEEDLEYIYEEKQILNEYIKNSSKYNELFHDNTITWKSDYAKGTNPEEVNITKEDDKFVLRFNDNISSVKMNYSRSYYSPYNIMFMDFFNQLMKYNEKNKTAVKKR